MLFEVAAVVGTMALGPVADAFGVHEISFYSTVETLPTETLQGEILPAGTVQGEMLPVQTLRAGTLAVATLPAARRGSDSSPRQGQPAAVMPQNIPDAPPSPFIGPEPSADPEEIVIANVALRQFAQLTPRELIQFLKENPGAASDLLAHPPAAREVTGWWQSLELASRVAITAGSPELVGNLEGIPYPIRDSANRSTLSSTIADLDAVIEGDSGRTIVENARQQVKMLRSIEDALTTSGDDPRRTLITLDVRGQGRAAIVVGDLRTADYVTYLVPGMFFTIENQMGDWADAATRLRSDELAWFERLHGAGQAASVATVAWIGYHTPNLTNVGGIENADEGRDALASAIQGLQSVRAQREPYIAVVAHSYGSTATLMALTDYDFEIDALAMVGSPGSPATSASDLHVRDGNVYVGEAAWDPIPNSSYFGSDPGCASYGARSLGVAGGVDPVTGDVMAGSVGHNEYFSPGTEAMRNFALIGIGAGQLVTDATGRSPARAFASAHPAQT